MAASYNLIVLAKESNFWLVLMSEERGVQISVKIPSQEEGLMESWLDSYWTWYVLEKLIYFWLVLLLKKYLLRHTAGLQKESHFSLKLWKTNLSKSLALKTCWGYRSGAAASIPSRFCQILAMQKHSKHCLIRKALVCSYSEVLISRRDRELLISQKQTWNFPAASTQVRV